MTDSNERAQEPAAEKTSGHGPCGCGTCKGDGLTMPKVSFSTFVMSLASSALVQLGEIPNPESGVMEQDLVLARHTIDILCMLQHKTCECLDPDESRLLEGALYDLRMKYVMKTK